MTENGREKSAADEVLEEAEEAETRVGEDEESHERRHDAEAADAVSPSPDAQRSAHERDE